MNHRLQILLKVFLLAGLITLAEIWPLIYGLEPIAGVDLAILSKLRPLLLFASIILSLIIALVFFNGIYRRRKGLEAGQDDSIILGMRNAYYIL